MKERTTPKESNLELKVGAFVVIALILLGVFVFLISDFSLFEKGQDIQAVFGFANGLKKSSPVRFAGVECGIVKDLEVFFDRKDEKTKVKINLWLKSGTEIPTDSAITINQLGLLGEKYIEIIPGISPEHLNNGAVVTGEDPIAMEKLSEMVTALAKKIDKSVEGFNSVVNNQKNQKSIEIALEGVSMIISNVREGKGTVGKLFYDESIYDDLQDFTADLKANPWKLLYRPKASREKK